MIEIKAINEIQDFIKSNDIAVSVFTLPSCAVCLPYKTKISQILADYPKVGVFAVNLEEVPVAKGVFQILTAPLAVVFVEGKEAKRYSAAVDFKEFQQLIDRYCSFFE